MALVRRAPDLFTVDAPLTFMGLSLGTRMTVVKLPDGSVLLHSPIPFDRALADEIRALGPVSHVVCPNAFHHLHAGPWKQAFPEAGLFGPRALHDKRRDLRFDGPIPAVAGLESLAIEGSLLEETVFLHAESGTLISSDLTENFVEPVDHLFTRLYLKANGTYGKPGWPRVLRVVYRDRRAARRSIDALLERPFDRVILAHGQILETGGRAAVRETFAFL